MEDDSKLSVIEYAYNACERKGTIESYKDFEKRLNSLEENITFDKSEDFQRIYLGFEYCENMMRFCNPAEVVKKVKLSASRGYKVSFELPVMHQKNISVFQKWIDTLTELNLIDEWIVNDLGTLELLGVSKKIVLGRMFDKANREVRQNILDIPEVKNSFELLQPVESVKSIYELLNKKYRICGAEVDTFPDGILKVFSGDFLYHVNYPDIYISSSSYCEYANVGDDDKKHFVIHQDCGLECCCYKQKIAVPVKSEVDSVQNRDIYKVGNVICGKQSKILEECVEGTCRIVYSERF